MSILIKGMEMPTSCRMCIIEQGESGYRWCGAIKKLKSTWDYREGRPDWCPLVPVQPHGDLVDIGAVNLEDGPYEYDEWIEWAFQKYLDAPVFLEADKEET